MQMMFSCSLAKKEKGCSGGERVFRTRRLVGEKVVLMCLVSLMAFQRCCKNNMLGDSSQERSKKFWNRGEELSEEPKHVWVGQLWPGQPGSFWGISPALPFSLSLIFSIQKANGTYCSLQILPEISPSYFLFFLFVFFLLIFSVQERLIQTKISAPELKRLRKTSPPFPKNDLGQ